MKLFYHKMCVLIALFCTFSLGCMEHILTTDTRFSNWYKKYQELTKAPPSTIVQEKMVNHFQTLQSIIETFRNTLSEDEERKLQTEIALLYLKTFQETTTFQEQSEESLLDSESDHLENPIHKREKEWLAKREPKIRSYLKKLLNNNPEQLESGTDPQVLPMIAFCPSGGGPRAALLTLGFLKRAQKTCLLDGLAYAAGVSGSTWMLNALTRHQHDIKSYIDTLLAEDRGISLKDICISCLRELEESKTLGQLINRLVNVLSGKEEFIEAKKWVVENLHDIRTEIARLFHIAYGRYVMRFFLTDSTDLTKLRLHDNGGNPDKPLAIYTAIERTDVNNPLWIEFTPFHSGSPQWNYYKSLTRQDLEQMDLGTYLAIFGNVLGATPQEAIERISEDFKAAFLIHVGNLIEPYLEKTIDGLQNTITNMAAGYDRLDSTTKTVLLGTAFGLIATGLIAGYQNREKLADTIKSARESKLTSHITTSLSSIKTNAEQVATLLDTCLHYEGSILATQVPNFLYGVANTPHRLQTRTMSLIDAGLGCNLAIPSLLHKARKVRIVIVCDWSSTTPTASVHKELELAEKLLKTDRFPFCNKLPSMTIEQDKPLQIFPGCPETETPTVIYISWEELRKVAEKKDKNSLKARKYGTFQSSYSHDEMKALISLASQATKQITQEVNTIILDELSKESAITQHQGRFNVPISVISRYGVALHAGMVIIIVAIFYNAIYLLLQNSRNQRT